MSQKPVTTTIQVSVNRVDSKQTRSVLLDINEEEKSTVRWRMSRETGYTGLPVLHRLYPMYGFLYDESTVYDEMHTISLNAVKNVLLDLLDDVANGFDWSIVDDQLDHIPWPNGMFLSNFHYNCCLIFFKICNRVSIGYCSLGLYCVHAVSVQLQFKLLLTNKLI